MAVTSREGFMSGQPIIEGHRFPVGQMVAEVDEMGGVEEVVYQFDFDKYDPEIRAKIKEAIDYCRSQKCDEDNEEGNLVRYCQDCYKREAPLGEKTWERAERVYQLNYGDSN